MTPINKFLTYWISDLQVLRCDRDIFNFKSISFLNFLHRQIKTLLRKKTKLSEIQPSASKQIIVSNIHYSKSKFTLDMNFIILCFVAIFSLNSWQRENIEAYFLSHWKIQLQKKRNWILYILLLERCNQKKWVNNFLSRLLPDTHQ